MGQSVRWFSRVCNDTSRRKAAPHPSTEWRTFSSGSSLYYPRSSPRWLNTRPPRTVTLEDHVNGSEEALVEGPDTPSISTQGSEDDNAASSGSSSQSDSAPPASSSSSGGDGSDDGQPPDSPPPEPSVQPATIIAKQSVPEYYPQVLALPIARRPLFPGFYKAVVIRNPAVVAAVKEMMKRGQPYLGAFLLKDENSDADVITDINQVHPVGVFAQITSVFRTGNGEEGQDKDEGLTAVLYPHRRIKLTELVQAGAAADSTFTAKIESTEEPIQEPTPPPSPSPESEPEGKPAPELIRHRGE